MTDPIVLPTSETPNHDEGELRFIGTATALIRYGGFSILTDPNFLHQGDHAPLGYGLRSRRLTEPALRIDELPPLDLIVLSHHHGDHFDDVAAEELDKDIPIVTTRHAAAKLRRQGFNRPVALDTWEDQSVVRGGATLRVSALPGTHAPRPLRALLPPVMGSMLEFADEGEVRFRLYITGDTLVHDRLQEIPRRYPDIDLAMIHLGGTRILGILLTMDAEQGVRALQIVRPRAAVPVHYDDYTVFKSPLADFQAAVGRAGPSLTTEVHYVERGGTHRFRVDRARLSRDRPA